MVGRSRRAARPGGRGRQRRLFDTQREDWDTDDKGVVLTNTTDAMRRRMHRVQRKTSTHSEGRERVSKLQVVPEYEVFRRLT